MCNGFTLIELLIVITIIGILASALTVAVRVGFKAARQAHCKSNLQQLGVAVNVYRSEHDDQVPDWISNLYPEYMDDLSTYVCSADTSSPKGSDTPMPSGLMKIIYANFYDKNPAAWDNWQGTGQTRNLAVTRCSYCYEFSAAEGASNWYGGDPLPAHELGFTTMGQYKRIQLLYGDKNNWINNRQMPYSASQVPLIRCYHHYKDQFILGQQGSDNTTIGRRPMVINVAYAGNVFVSPPYWEGMSRLGK